MSRLAKKKIEVPKTVEVKVEKGKVFAKGSLGSSSLNLKDGIVLDVKEGALEVLKDEKSDINDAEHGLFWALIKNLVTGVDKGFLKKLTLVGVGFRASVSGDSLDMQVGYSHPTKLKIPKGLSVKVEKNIDITISGIDKQAVGQFASKVRAIRPPEPYKGKGVRYVDEYVRKKAGKAAKGKGA